MTNDGSTWHQRSVNIVNYVAHKNRACQQGFRMEKSRGEMETDILVIIEILLWIASIIVLSIAGLFMVKKYRKERKSYTLGSTYFFLLFAVSKICIFFNIFVFGYTGSSLFLIDQPIWLWLQIGYTVFSYTGALAIYITLEKEIIKDKHIFSIITVFIMILSIIQYMVEADLFLYELPLYLTVILGIPSVYIYLFKRFTGQLRKYVMMIVVGILILELGMAMGIPEAQLNLWSKFLPWWFYKYFSSIFLIIGCIILLDGFYHSGKLK